MQLKVIMSQAGKMGFESGDFTSIHEIELFIGGRGNLYCLHLPNEIDIWMNRDIQKHGAAPLNGCIVDEADFSYENFLYGNIFFAGRGTNGGTVSLSITQRAWIYTNMVNLPNSTQPFVFRLNVVEMEVA